MMKFIFYFIIATLFLSIVISCRSHEEKGDGAFKDFKEDKLVSLNAKSNFIDSTIVNSNLLAYQKLSKLNEEMQFKTDLETIIKSNNSLILNLKHRYKLNKSIQKKIIQLEIKNNRLITKFQSYEVSERQRRLMFEKKIMKDIVNVNLSIVKFNNLK